MKKKKIVVVTGVTGGIGEAIAHLLVEKGHIVYGGDKDVEKLKAMEKLGIKALPLDVTDEGSAKDFVSKVKENEGRIDVLVNCAGYGSYGPMETTSLEEAKKELDVNVLGLARMSQEVMPIMREQTSGTIINMSSTGGKYTLPFGGWYHASKYAVEALSDAMRMELSPFGVNVAIIEPSGIATPFGNTVAKSLNDSSLGTVYEDDAAVMVKAYEAMFSEKSKAVGSPNQVAKTVLKIIGKKKPRTRYRVGPFATTLVILRHIWPNRFFDWVMKKVMMKASKKGKRPL